MSITREELLAEARRRGLIPQDPSGGETASTETRDAALSGVPESRPADRMRSFDVGLRTAAAEFIGNVLGIPHAVGELLAVGGAALEAGAGAAGAALRGEPLELGRRFDEARRSQEQQFPANVLRQWPNPSAQDVLRAAETVRQLPSAITERRSLSEGVPLARERADEAVAVEAEAHPIATAVGEVAGDIATLVSGRPGLRALLRRADPSRVVPEARKIADTATAKLMRGLGRSAEAGFEGALIGALSDADPAEIAAWSAGIQAGGSLALTAKEAVRKAPFKSFATLWLGHEMYRAVAPGPQDAFTSKDETIRELVAAYGLGIIATLAGAGRGSEANRVADAISAASRAGIASVVSQLKSADERGERHYGEIVAKIVEDPDAFGPEVRRRLELAARRERPNALLEEIDALMKLRPFRRKYEELKTEESDQ